MSKDLKVNITGDGSKLNNELVKSANSVAKLEMQTKKANKEVHNLTGGFRDVSVGLKNCDFGAFNRGLTSIGSNINNILPNLGQLAKSLINPYTAAAAAIGLGGKALYDYGKELDRTLQKTEQFTGLSGDELVSLRSGIKAVADTYNKDFDSVLSSVDGLMNQFGISSEEALTIVKNGFKSGADDGGAMLDMISKYSGAFSDAGISASELVAIIGNTRSGIFSEEGMQLFQKGATKIREWSTQLQDALTNAGINADEMYSKLQSGEITTVQAIQQISTHLKGLSPQSQEVGNVLKQVFGKAGAAAGYELVTSLADVETNLDTVKNQTGEWGSAMDNLANSQREFETALAQLFGSSTQGFSTMTTQLKANVYGSVAKVINGFIDWYNNSLLLRGAINQIAITFKNAWEVIKLILKVFFNQIKSLSDMIEGIFTLDWEKVKSGWKNGIESITKNIADAFSNISNNMQEAVDNTLNGSIKKIEVPVEVEYSENSNNTNSSTTNTKSTDKAKNNSKTNKNNSKTEVTKTQLEIDRENLQAVNKKVKESLSDFNDGLIDKSELEKAIKEANDYYQSNGIKAIAEIEYNFNEEGWEQAQQKKPLIYKTALELKRDSFNEIQNTIKQVGEDFNNGLIDETYLSNQINNINAKLKELGLEPVQISFNADGSIEIIDELTAKTKELKDAQTKAQENAAVVSSAFSSMGNVFSALSGSMDENTAKVLEMAGATMNAVSQMIPQIIALIGAKEGEALASGTASAASLPFPANIAAIASIVATITGLFASFAGSFADGGIIGGSTTIGDYNIARVNKGEMILNGRQQGNLFKLLNNNVNSNTNNGGGHVEFVISGSQLRGVLKNYNNKISKTK
ncbi:MAG: phage tail tape measure protein [Mycoplasmoidaceae bacterium]|nr:phage tail tape measure protein [Mycoplasmoidaceae bacterium]